MKLLPLTKTTIHSGTETTLTQVVRDDNKAIYSVTIGGKVCAYEVFKIRKQAETLATFNGTEVVMEAKELLPNDEMFGTTAWSYPTLEAAQAKYDSYDPLLKKTAGRKKAIK